MRQVLYRLHNDQGSVTVDIDLLESGAIQVFFHDVGASAKRAHGDDDYEHWVEIPSDSLPALAFALLTDRLTGNISAVEEAAQLCELHRIPHEVFCF